jgi:hypothetical protein
MKPQSSNPRRVVHSNGKLSFALVAAVVCFVGGVLLAASQLDAARLPPSLPGALRRGGSERLGLGDDLAISEKKEVIRRALSELLEKNSSNFPRSATGSTFCTPWPLCALAPTEPPYFHLCDLLNNWSPDNPNMSTFASSPATSPGGVRDPLPIFDFSDPTERFIAQSWRKAEVPFMLKHVPDLDRARALWSNDFFLREMFENTEYKIESAVHKSHFLYFAKTSGLRGGNAPADWEPPQVHEAGMTYRDFEAVAKGADERAAAVDRGIVGEVESTGANVLGAAKTLYLTISSGLGARTKWIVESLPFLKDDHDFFRINYPAPFHGINCRFGMRGVVQVIGIMFIVCSL